MAITPAATGQGVACSSSEERFFIPAQNAEISTLCVRNKSTATNPVTVRIPELHGEAGSGVGALLPIGEKEYFRVKHGALTEAYVIGTGGLIDWYGVASTKR